MDPQRSPRSPMIPPQRHIRLELQADGHALPLHPSQRSEAAAGPGLAEVKMCSAKPYFFDAGVRRHAVPL